MNARNDELLQAVELALAGKWDTAHQIVQQFSIPAHEQTRLRCAMARQAG